MKNSNVVSSISLIKFFELRSLSTYAFMLMLSFILFSTSSCQKDDESPCNYKVCSNGGRLTAQCDCNCPTGFQGPTCDDEVAPTRMKIIAVRVTKHLSTKPDGNPWDPFTDEKANPDLNVKVRYSEGSESKVILDTKTILNVLPSMGTISMEIIQNDDIIFPAHSYRVSLYDFDRGSSDDFMGGKNFFPYTKGEKFPTTIKVGNSKFEVELDVKYTW